MSTLSVNIKQGDESRRFYIVNTKLGLDDVEHVLTEAACPNTQKQADENAIVFNFLERTGSIVSFETPQSSNVVRVTFNAETSEIGFVFDNESESTYPATFADFVAAMNAPSIGKLQWRYRRATRGR